MEKKEHPSVKLLSNVYFEDSQNKVNLRFLPSAENYFLELEALDKIPEILKTHSKEGAYFQIAMCDGRGGKGNITEIPALWVDVDFKKGFGPEEFEKLPGTPFRPSFTIDSGGGRHLYWLLKEPAEKTDIPEVENLLKRLAQVYQGDPAAAEAARILRLPGTLNRKYDPLRWVKILEFEPDRKYDLSDFDEYLPELDKSSAAGGVYQNSPGWEKPIIEEGVREGERNYTIARLAGRYIRKGLSQREILPILLDVNFRFSPPLDIDEVERTLASMIETNRRNNPPEEYKEETPLEEVYSGWAGRYSAMMSRTLESPRSFWYFSALTCLGTLLSDKVTLATETEPQPRLYTLLLGESAWDRKSTAISMTAKFFQEAIKDFPLCFGVGSAEGLAEQFKGSEKLLLIHDEFRAFVGKAKIDTSVLLPVVNTLFESNRYQSSTKKHTINLKNAQLSILAASTVETYQTMFDAQFLDIGFVNRLLVIKDHGQRRWAIPPKVDGTEKAELKRHLGEMLQMIREASNSGTVEIELDAEVGAMFEDWYHQLPESTHAKRLDTYGHRLMVLLAINEGKTRIDTQIIQKVITILNWEYHVRSQVDPIQADSKIAKMEERVRRGINNGITLRDLKKAVHYERYGLFIFNSALNNLLKAKEIRYDAKTRRYYRLDS